MLAERGATYDAAYHVISYPGGDVSPDRGVCTDVVIRAFRHAGVDLQKEIHEDMRDHFDIYPSLWGLSRPDPNIDHRRVPNQRTFFERHGAKVTDPPEVVTSWQPGDVVVWRLPGGRLHTGVLIDRIGASGFPLVVHNLSRTRAEDCLHNWEKTGHYRYRP